MVHRWAMTGLAVVLFSSAAAAQPAQTVNSYTPAQAEQALAAAQAAGYTAGNVSFAQAGDFFINASRGTVVEIPALAISSTECRARVEAGQPVWYLVPDGVVQYIAKRALYAKASEVPA